MSIEDKLEEQVTLLMEYYKCQMGIDGLQSAVYNTRDNLDSLEQELKDSLTTKTHINRKLADIQRHMDNMGKTYEVPE